ncbi:alpha/beta hydrolase [Neptuniibacter marinus]|uniref:alpha/beta hydrolase n=1 Tax=Neptuniibacter marinus TaxID=1806670 RepID=UPI003B5AEAEF
MLRIIIALFLASSLLNSSNLYAEEITLKYKHLDLNANLYLTEENGFNNILLITHGTLAHNGMEIIATWQELLADEGMSSLAINLSLGLDNRHGMYDCKTPHTHKHTDAIHEIAAWVDWLKAQGSQAIILAAHSRGGNQTAWYADTHSDPAIKGQILIAPQTWSEQDETASYTKRYQHPLQAQLEKAMQLTPNDMLIHTDFIYCEDTQVAAASFVNYYQANPRFDTPALLSKTTLPTLVFSGSEDTIVNGLFEKMEALNNDVVQNVQIEGADHFFRDLYMDEVTEHSLEFIEQL